jgi:hypothetical protein
MTDGARSDAQVRPKREDYDTVQKYPNIKIEARPVWKGQRWTDGMVKVKRSGDGGRGRCVKLLFSG